MRIDFEKGSARLMALAGLGIAAALAGPAHAQQDFSGQNIHIIVPFSQGGATDVAARFLEPYLEKHLPGNPSVEVINRPGGGSILGANSFAEQAQPDGLTFLFTTSSTANPYILGQEEVNYDLSKMRVGFSLPFGSVAYVSPTTGVESAEELKNPDRPLVYGGIAAAASDLPGLLAFEVLDLDVKTVLGFPGRGPIRLAFERGETNFDYQFTPVYMTQVRQLVDSGKAVPLYTGGFLDAEGNLTERDPVVSDLPSVYELYKTMNNGEEPSGEAWDAFQAIAAVTYAYGLTAYFPEETPQEIIDAYSEAAERINADPEFQEANKEVTGGYELIPGAEAEPALKRALQPSDEVKTYLRDLLSTKYDVTF